MFKKLFFATVLACALGAVPGATGAPANVVIGATGFNPSSVTIEAGETVTWRNSDSQAHRVVVTGAQCNLSLQPLQSSSCEFKTAGRLSYSDPGESGSGFRGTIEVEPAPTRGVTLIASRPIVTFGDSVRLSGAISSRQQGQTVTVIAAPAGDPARRIDVETGEGGQWTLRVQPRLKTRYTARWHDSASDSFTALVRPRVAIRKVGRSVFSVVVVAADSFAGDFVQVMRQRSRKNARLVTVRRVILRENPRTDTTAQRTFRLRVRRGFKMRAFLPQSQAGRNYVASWSNFIRA